MVSTGCALAHTHNRIHRKRDAHIHTRICEEKNPTIKRVYILFYAIHTVLCFVLHSLPHPVLHSRYGIIIVAITIPWIHAHKAAVDIMVFICVLSDGIAFSGRLDIGFGERSGVLFSRGRPSSVAPRHEAVELGNLGGVRPVVHGTDGA